MNTNETTKPPQVGGSALNDGLESVPAWVAEEIRETWNAAQAKGQMEAYRVIQIMVDRLGYGRIDGNPKGF